VNIRIDEYVFKTYIQFGEYVAGEVYQWQNRFLNPCGRCTARSRRAGFRQTMRV
jgi:hypothetical protein